MFASVSFLKLFTVFLLFSQDQIPGVSKEFYRSPILTELVDLELKKYTIKMNYGL